MTKWLFPISGVFSFSSMVVEFTNFASHLSQEKSQDLSPDLLYKTKGFTQPPPSLKIPRNAEWCWAPKNTVHDSIYSFLYIYRDMSTNVSAPVSEKLPLNARVVSLFPIVYTQERRLGRQPPLTATTLGPTRCQVSCTKQPPVCHGPHQLAPAIGWQNT